MLLRLTSSFTYYVSAFMVLGIVILVLENLNSPKIHRQYTSINNKKVKQEQIHFKLWPLKL